MEINVTTTQDSPCQAIPKKPLEKFNLNWGYIFWCTNSGVAIGELGWLDLLQLCLWDVGPPGILRFQFGPSPWLDDFLKWTEKTTRHHHHQNHHPAAASAPPCMNPLSTHIPAAYILSFHHFICKNWSKSLQTSCPSTQRRAWQGFGRPNGWLDLHFLEMAYITNITRSLTNIKCRFWPTKTGDAKPTESSGFNMI